MSEHLSSVVESNIIDNASKRTLQMISNKYDEILYEEKLFSLYSQTFLQEFAKLAEVNSTSFSAFKTLLHNTKYVAIIFLILNC